MAQPTAWWMISSGKLSTKSQLPSSKLTPVFDLFLLTWPWPSLEVACSSYILLAMKVLVDRGVGRVQWTLSMCPCTIYTPGVCEIMCFFGSVCMFLSVYLRVYKFVFVSMCERMAVYLCMKVFSVCICLFAYLCVSHGERIADKNRPA